MKIHKRGSRCVCFFISAMIALILVGCSGQKVLTAPSDPEKTFHFKNLKGWEKTDSLNNYVVYVNKGDTVPLAISMDTDFLDFKQNQIEMVAKRKLYFRIKMPDNLSKEEIAKLNKITAEGVSKWSADQQKAFLEKYMLYISTDAIHWAPLNSKQALKKILGFKMGALSAGMKASTTDGLGASLNIKTIK